jgi:hypothetical protein
MLTFKTKKQLFDFLVENSPETQLCDGLEGAFIGLAESFGGFIAVYDRGKIIDMLEKDMSREEAEEYFSFNIVGAYVGPLTPVYLVCKVKGKLK